MKIGEIADRAGVSAKTVRYYEEIGLLPEPPRTTSGYRDYGEDAVGQLQFIRDSQGAGLSLAEIGSILDMKAQGLSTCEHTLTLVRRHIDEIDAQIAALRENRRAMVALADAAADVDPAACSDPNRCQVIAAASAARDDSPHHVGDRRQLSLHDA